MLKRFLLWSKGWYEIIRAHAYFNKGSYLDKYRPDFVVAGMQKSGTSWLYKILSMHPDISMSSRKETHYFDKFRSRGWKWYYYHFRHGANKVKGEITPGYSILSIDQIIEIQKMNPNIKVIFLVRNPFERDWSQVVMDCYSNTNLKDVLTQDLIKAATSYGVIQRGDYCRIFQTWLQVIPSDQMLILEYNQIAENPEDLLSKIYSFLNVNEIKLSNEVVSQRVNVNRNLQMPTKVREVLKERHLRKLECLKGYLETSIIEKWKNEIQNE